MKAILYCICLLLLLNNASARAHFAKDSLRVFKDETPLQITISTNLKKMLFEKAKGIVQPATISISFPDSSVITEKISLNARGVFRRKNCYLPSLKLHFKSSDSSRLKKLKDLKLVCPCGNGKEDEQLLLKEYLVYKMYNLLTDKSFKVRLARITFTDSEKARKDITKYTFFIEDIDALADRNKCKEVNNLKLHTENTNRQHTTLVTIFQYMIGNTDWAVPVNHNVKFITNKKPPVEKPYIIPYDFDFAGIVNAYYATPSKDLGTTSVQERAYRGFGRTMEELLPVITLLNEQKNNIYGLIQNFALLADIQKRSMTKYLDEFYNLVSSPANIRYEFIDNARTE
ncbi:hypothetical protein [Foetidibacter luteolus]|uniref:hypothetical protein n=1 Tax=Foetidibacter luteolus TaxID=2608880 RepID=UPI00129C00FC|nr:hypothetical protein [Foetidibacter luteolus]